MRISGAENAGIYMSLVPLFTAATGIFVGMELTNVHVISGILICMGLLSGLEKKRRESNF